MCISIKLIFLLLLTSLSSPRDALSLWGHSRDQGFTGRGKCIALSAVSLQSSLDGPEYVAAVFTAGTEEQLGQSTIYCLF